MMQAPTPYRPRRPGSQCTIPTNNTLQIQERDRLNALHKLWQAHTPYLEALKSNITGGLKPPPLVPWGNNFHLHGAMGWWDAHRRMTMLEPIAADVLLSSTPVRGDFVEAGVFRGAISLHMAGMLKVSGALSAGPRQRRMWLADAFGRGMPNDDYSARVLRRTATTVASIETQNKNWAGQFKGPELSVTATMERFSRALGTTRGVYAIPGYYNESLPGPLKARSIALLRVDADTYASTYEVLEALYPLVVRGGYVVFDDWKIWQAQQAILQYRMLHNIQTPIFASRRDWQPPLQTIDCMAFWKKEFITPM